MATADDWVTVGSSNIDPFSLLLAREANLVVLDNEFAAHLKACLQVAIDDGAVQVHAATHARSWFQRLLHRAAYGALRVAVALSGAAGRY